MRNRTFHRQTRYSSSFSHTYTLSLPLTLRVRVRVCIDSSLHALSMSNLVDSLASIGRISKASRVTQSFLLFLLFFTFVDLFLSYFFFFSLLHVPLFFPPILFVSKSGAPVHVRIFSCSFTPLNRPSRDIWKMYKLIYFSHSFFVSL